MHVEPLENPPLATPCKVLSKPKLWPRYLEMIAPPQPSHITILLKSYYYSANFILTSLLLFGFDIPKGTTSRCESAAYLAPERSTVNETTHFRLLVLEGKRWRNLHPLAIRTVRPSFNRAGRIRMRASIRSHLGHKTDNYLNAALGILLISARALA